MRLAAFLLILFSSQCLAQWSNLKGGINAQGRCLLYDSTSNSLIVSGNFFTADTLLTNHIASWDGQNWNGFGSGAPYGAPGYSITKFQNELYLSSIFYPSATPNWLAKWSGTNWDTISPNVTGPVYCFKNYANELYLGGAFTSIGTDTVRMLAKYNGFNFTSFPLPCDWGNVSAIEFFQGQMYIGGNFLDTISQINDLEYFDGNTFLPFGSGGLATGSDYVSSLETYNNDLYIGGSFSTSTGAAGNNIMKWDGTTRHSVGSGINGSVYRMKAYQDGLYVCGVFNMAGSIQVSGIAKWNGIQWHEVIPYVGNIGITDFLINDNDLFITGLFSQIDSIQMNNIARFSLPTNITENEDALISFSPNPVSDMLMITLKGFKEENAFMICIYDLLGKAVAINNSHNNNYIQIDVNGLSSGAYLIRIEMNSKKYSKLFIKQ